jgi:serine/threonine protein kinase
LCDDPAFVGRFEREADTVAQLDQPNIVAVHDRGSQDGQLWISMRYIDGTNAEKALADYHSGMPPERAVRIVSKVASALDYAHRRDLLHRDVKPANILLASGSDDDDETERVFLSDFGVAKSIGVAAEREASLTSTGGVVATLDYASPEQIKGQPLDHRSDIYALGCVLHKLLTGSVPYPGQSVAARVYGHLNNPPPAPSARVPSVPQGFDDVVATAMAKEPADSLSDLPRAGRPRPARPWPPHPVVPAGPPTRTRAYRPP